VNTRLAKNRRIRIALLELLKSAYPGALDQRALMFAMDNLGYPMPEDRLAAHLSYLEEKGYLVAEERRGEGFEVSFASLTAEGWDLLDGMHEDGGVDTRL
jgi:hypothetical protein